MGAYTEFLDVPDRQVSGVKGELDGMYWGCFFVLQYVENLEQYLVPSPQVKLHCEVVSQTKKGLQKRFLTSPP